MSWPGLFVPSRVDPARRHSALRWPATMGGRRDSNHDDGRARPHPDRRRRRRDPRLLAEYLRKNGLRATAVADGKAMWAALERGRDRSDRARRDAAGRRRLDAVPQAAREVGDMPVIMLTARGEETDRIVGPGDGRRRLPGQAVQPARAAGAHQGVLRRTRSLPPNLRADDSPRARASPAGRWTPSRAHLISPDGVVTPLSGAEFRLLRIFLSHPQSRADPRPADRPHAGPRGRSARPQHRRAGEPPAPRLGDDPRDPRIIKTVRGEGYVLAVAVTGRP